MYYLHDKESQTSERVDWTQTRNMPVQDPNAAVKWMAYTASNAERIKQEAGVPMTGRKREKGTVYTFSLSWSPEESPGKDRMVKAADETLEKLGLKEHEVLIVSHNDTPHKHIHCIVNLVNPKDGRMYDPDWGSKLKLSDWSLKHEFENGKVYCEQRAENNEERKKGNRVRYQEPLHDRKAEIQELYRQSDSGQSFRAALEGNGYTLATGNRRSFVLVDDYGKIYSLTRQLDNEQRKNHLQKLADIDQASLPLAQTMAEERQYFDRDKYEAEQQQKIEDTAIEQERKKVQVEKQQQKTAGKEKNDTTPSAKEKEENTRYDDSHLVRLDRQRAWEQWAGRKRYALEQQQEQVYKRGEQVEKIKTLEKQIASNDNIFGKVSGKLQSLREEIEAQKKTLAGIDHRMSEQTSSLEIQLQKTNPQKAQGGGKSQTMDFEPEKRRKADGRERPDQDQKGKNYNLDR